MAFGTGAVTAAVIGAGVAGGIGVGGNVLMNSLNKGGGINTKSIKKTLENYMAQINSAIQAGQANTNAAISGMDEKIAKYTGELRDASDSETKAFWNNLGVFNDSLINSASALVNEYDGDVTRALDTLQTNIGKLNEGYASDMGKEIERYGSVEDAINAKLASDENVAETRFLNRVNQNQAAYQKNTFQEVDKTQKAIFGEDNKFMASANQARADYLSANADSETRFRADEKENLTKRDKDLRASESDYRRDTLAEADRLSTTTKTLGDTFLDQISGTVSSAKDETDALRRELISGTPSIDPEAEARRSLAFNTENAAAFGALADTLSKAAQKTRMDLLATADPRALELSAIADENAAAMMSGRISADVQANLARSSAMRALSGGFGAGSEMGRGLTSRDLGLTSLDLMQRGTEMYDAQRRLNYDTRVAGTQVDPLAVMEQSGLSTDQALRAATDNASLLNDSRRTAADIGARGISDRMNAARMGFESNLDARLRGETSASGLRADAFGNIFDNQRTNIADAYREMNLGARTMFDRRGNVIDTNTDNRLRLLESSRNLRVGALQEASGQRLQTFDRLFGANMGVADTLRGQDMTLAGQLSDNRRDANLRNTGMRTAVTQDIYNNMMGLSDTVFNSRLGLAGQKLSTGLSVAGDIYKTNAGGADSVFGTRLQLENSIFGGRSNAAVTAMQEQAAYQRAALAAQAAALGNVAATQTNIPVMQAAQRQAGANASAQMWGSALQAGSSLAGSYLGNSNWNSPARGYGGGLAGTYSRGAYTTPYKAGPSASLIS